ncbi:hypothetical protein [Parapedobacter sp.]
MPLFGLFTEIYAGHMGMGPGGRVREGGLDFTYRRTGARKAPHHGRVSVLCSGHHLAVSLRKTAL